MLSGEFDDALQDFRGKTAPVGLCGLFSSTTLVRALKAASRAAISGMKSGASSGAVTCVAPDRPIIAP